MLHKTGENTQENRMFWYNARVGKPLWNAMFSLRSQFQENIHWTFSRSGRMVVVKCAGKYTVEVCFPCAGKLGMNSIFYLCYPTVNTEFSTFSNTGWTRNFLVINPLVKLSENKAFIAVKEMWILIPKSETQSCVWIFLPSRFITEVFGRTIEGKN